MLHEPRKDSLLDHYHCTFFLPLLGIESKGLAVNESNQHVTRQLYQPSEEMSEEDAQAYHFFTPTLREILFDSGSIPLSQEAVTNRQGDAEPSLVPVREWRIDEKAFANWELQLKPSPSQEQGIESGKDHYGLYHQTTVFKSIHLYQYFNGIYILSFRVEPKVLSKLRQALEVPVKDANGNNIYDENGKLKTRRCSVFEEGQLTHQYFSEIPNSHHHYDELGEMQLEAWLRFSRLARQLYCTFSEQGDEGKVAPMLLSFGDNREPIKALDQVMSKHVPSSLGSDLSDIVGHIASQFFDRKVMLAIRDSIRLFDDRMFISVGYGLAGKQYEDLDRLRALIMFTDRYSDCWGNFDGYPYDKASIAPMREKAEYNLWSGEGGHYIFTDMVNAYLSRGSFFREIAAIKHIPYIYDRMMVQALFYLASLRFYDHRITQDTQQMLVKKNPTAVGNIRQQREQFSRFTNQYWFQNITNQMQGKAIFNLQQQGLEIAPYYEQLEGEISRTNEYLQAVQDSQVSDNANRVGWAALIIAVIALLPVINDIYKVEDPSMWKHMIDYLTTNYALSEGAAKLVISGGVTGTLAIVVWRLAFPKKQH